MADPESGTVPPQPAHSGITGGSLFGEMLDWMVAPFLMLWPLSIGLTYLIGISLANDAFDRNLASKTRALAEQAVWTQGETVIQLRADLQTILAEDDAENYFFRIDSAQGRYLLGEPELATIPPEEMLTEGLVTFRTVDFREVHMRLAAISRALPTGTSPRGQVITVTIAESMGKRTALANEIIKGIVFPQLLVIPMMVVLMWLGLKRGAAPLSRLRAQVASRSASDVRPLHAPDAPEEVAPLINAFNELLARVEREGEAQKRFVANAAHQLRTPLAGIRMQAELALRSRDALEQTAALQKIADGTARTAHLMSQLLMLARTEGAAVDALPFVALDFGAISREVVAAAYPLASERHIELAFESGESAVMLNGHAELLRELVSNLVDNAIRYTPERGHITVRVFEAVAPTLEVEDDGIGIAEAERELVFERFYRVIGGQASGSGIGLAIIKEIALRHGATVTVATPVGGVGSVFRVVFAGGM